MNTLMRYIAMAALMGLWIGPARAQTNTPEFLFQKAMHLETAKGDYRGAISVYEEILKNHKQKAEWTAKALYREGLCWEKLGDKTKAGECARQLFCDHAALVTQDADMALFAKKYPQKVYAPGNEKILKKLNGIVIPEFDFVQANVVQVFKYLNKMSVALDTQSPPADRGVNFIFGIPMPEQTSSSSNATSVLTGPLDYANAPSIPTLTLNLKNIKLIDAVKYICEVTGLQYRVDSNAVFISRRSMPDGAIVTKVFKVIPTLVEMVQGGQKQSSDKSESMKNFFLEAGVSFPVGSSLEFNPDISALIVKNTEDNLDKLQQILTQLNMVPIHIKILAELIEVPGEQADALDEKLLLTREELERIPRDKIRYLSRLTVITKSGQNTETKSIRSISMSSDKTVKLNGTFRQGPPELVVEIGDVMNATPVVGPDNYTIHITIVWESNVLMGWTNVNGRAASMPVVATKSIVTKISLWDQKSIVLEFQQDQGRTGKEKVPANRQYLIVSAVILGPDGRPIHDSSGNTVR